MGETRLMVGSPEPSLRDSTSGERGPHFEGGDDVTLSLVVKAGCSTVVTFGGYVGQNVFGVTAYGWKPAQTKKTRHK